MQWGASLSKSNFAHPTESRPERWLDSGKAPSSPFASDRRDACQLFSLGLCSCLGQKLANFELRLLLVRVVYNSDLELSGGLGSGVKWADQKTLLLG